MRVSLRHERGSQLWATQLLHSWGILALTMTFAKADKTVWCQRLPNKCRGASFSMELRSGDADPFKDVSVQSPFRGAPVAVTDWNGDGLQDLLVGDKFGRVHYYMQLGDGSVQHQTGEMNPFSVVDIRGSTSSPVCPAVGDWDGDGDLDLAVGNRAGQVYYYEQVVNGSLKHHVGDDNPFSVVNLSSSEGVGSVAPVIVDWDVDGILDLVVGSNDGTLHYYAGQGDGKLHHMTGEENPFDSIRELRNAAPAIVDFDEDGDMDLVLGGQSRLSYYERQADGSLQPHTGVANPFHGIVLNWYASPTIVDWDADGDLDLVVGDLSRVHFHERQKLLNVHAFPVYASAFRDISVGSIASPAVGDWDGDGDLDLIVGDAAGSISYYERQADRSLQERIGGANPFDGVAIRMYAAPVVVDWDGDGDLDLLVGGSTYGDDWVAAGIDYYERQHNGSLRLRTGSENPFAAVQSFDGSAYALAPAVADWDGDGDLDVVAGDYMGNLWYYEHQADGYLQARTGDASPFKDIDPALLSYPAVVDWDADGDMDLVVGDSSGQVRYFERQSSGTLLPRAGSENPFGAIGKGGCAPVVADWNGDGELAVVIGSMDGKVLEYVRSCNLDSSLAACNKKGLCNEVTGRCECIASNDGSDCSLCSALHFKSADRCQACPRSGMQVCSQRGFCQDDARARQQCTVASPFKCNQARGNGKCQCPDFFSGLACEDGVCPAGTELKLVENSSDQFNGFESCLPCPRGSYKSDADARSCLQCKPGSFQDEVGAQECNACPAGKFQGSYGAHECSPCRAGKYAEVASGQCNLCELDRIPTTSQTACEPCDWGMSANFGDIGCRYHYPLLVASAAYVICLAVVLSIVIFYAGRRLRIIDISIEHSYVNQEGGHSTTVITTKSNHSLQGWHCKPSFPVRFSRTGHPGLDGKRFMVDVQSSSQLAMREGNGSFSEARYDTSTGYFRLEFPHELMHIAWYFPIAFWLLCNFCAAVSLASIPKSVSGWQPGFQGKVGSLSGVAIFLAVAISVPRRLALHREQTSLERRLADFQNALSMPGRCPKGIARGIALGKLQRLHDFFAAFIRDRNAYYLDSNILRPLTAAARVSYAELVGPGEADWFVSHFWGTAFTHFCAALRKHATSGSAASQTPKEVWEQTKYWVCFCSNNQYQVEEELGNGDIFKSSFYLSLSSGKIRGTCMILDELALPLTRAWCIFELLQTILLKRDLVDFSGLLLCTATGVLNFGEGSMDVALSLSRHVAQLDLENAGASHAEDRKMISSEVVAQLGSFGAMNSILHKEMAGAMREAQRHSQHDFAAIIEKLESKNIDELPSPRDEGAIAKASQRM